MIATIVASVAVVIAAFQAWLSWRGRNDFAKSLLAAKRIELAAQFLAALEAFDDSVSSVLAVLHARPYLASTQEELAAADSTVIAMFDNVDLTHSTLRLVFPAEVVDIAHEIVGDLIDVRRDLMTLRKENVCTDSDIDKFVVKMHAVKGKWIDAANAQKSLSGSF